MSFLTIASICGVDEDGPVEMIWASLDGEKFLPVEGLDEWREWDVAPAEVVEQIADLLQPEWDPLKNVTRHVITYARRYLSMRDAHFTEIVEE